MSPAAVLDSPKNNCSWYGPHLVEEMLSEWSVTRAFRDAQRVVIEKRSEPGTVTWFSPLHRHQPRYRNKQRNRVARLRDYPRPARYLLTLTVDPQRYASDREAYAGLLESWRKIYHRLKRRSDCLQVLRVAEPQKNGQPHLHALLWGVHLPRGWAAEMYREVGSGYVHVAPVRHGNPGAVSYLGKYLTKASDLTLGALTRWGAQTLTVCGREMREHLGPLNNEEPTGEWLLVQFICSYQDACVLFSEGFADDLYEYPTGPPPNLP